MQEKVAELLLKIEAVFLRPNDPFTWASGIKSPIYCDNRLILSYPAVRRQIEEALSEMIMQNYPTVELLAGTSTAGIAHAALASEILELPMAYVRGAAKDHGRQNQIEGRILVNQRVVVVEDLISTGGSVIEVVDALRDAKVDVLGIASIFNYEMARAVDRFKEADVKNVSLSNFSALIDVALEMGKIHIDDVKKLRAFQKDPTNEEWQTM